MSSQPNPQHLAWADRLFVRFSAIWGAQKLGAMFPAESQEDVRAIWAAQLARFEPATIGAALQAMTDAGREWPPSLSEFTDACRQSAIARRAHAPAVALPLPKASPEIVARAVMDVADAVSPRRASRAWAHRIIERHRAGESVSIAALQMARRAIDAPVESGVST